jgi:hypothetical protein
MFMAGPDYEILGRYALLKNGPNSVDQKGAWVECLIAFFHDFSAEVTPPSTLPNCTPWPPPYVRISSQTFAMVFTIKTNCKLSAVYLLSLIYNYYNRNI